MKTRLLLLLLVLLGAAAVVFLLVRSPGSRPEGGNARPGASSVDGSSRPGAGSTERRPRPGLPPAGPAARSGRLASAAPPDSGTEDRAEAGEPSVPPHREKLAAEALLRKRDLLRSELSGLKERVPRLKNVLQRLRGSAEATPQAIEQIQTQLQQALDAVSRLERQLPEIEAEAAKVKKPAGPEKAEPSKNEPAP